MKGIGELCVNRSALNDSRPSSSSDLLFSFSDSRFFDTFFASGALPPFSFLRFVSDASPLCKKKRKRNVNVTRSIRTKRTELTYVKC